MAIVSLSHAGAGADMAVEHIPNVGKGRAELLHKLGIATIHDLLYHLPRRHEDTRDVIELRQLTPGTDPQTVWARVTGISSRWSQRRRIPLVEATLEADGARASAIWFQQPWLAHQLHHGTELLLSGRVEVSRRGLTLVNPKFERVSAKQVHVGLIAPVYAETKGLTSKWLRGVVERYLPLADGLPDPIPPAVRIEQELLPVGAALRQAHFPDDTELLERARERIAFEELFLLQLAAQRARRRRLEGTGVVIPYEQDVARELVATLPFQLTEGQRVAAHEILLDLAGSGPMNRLLQGDVGSGKTVVAALAARMAHAAGVQTVVMAPTEILARQHHATFEQMLGPAGIGVRLLVGSTPARARREIQEGVAAGHDTLLVGTHALIEEAVSFAHLGLVVVDEQHRFGVAQRQQLRQKSSRMPNFLAMTATPIPRSLALTAYGDVDVSELREMPAGRTPVETRVVPPEARARAYDFVRGEVAAGRQAFVICPVIDESDRLGVRSASEEHRRLSDEVFPELRVGLLHGRMRASEKEERMAAFVSGDVDVLVSTSVVEVGVDIPNASVMLIEGAERFGLAQLHQFRGRVGRGAVRSFCLLFQGAPDEAGAKRLVAVAATPSGFELAEMDLRLRGPGEVAGLRQHGLPEMRAADLLDDALMRRARDAASAWLDEDPTLTAHLPLARAMSGYRAVFDLD